MTVANSNAYACLFTNNGEKKLIVFCFSRQDVVLKLATSINLPSTRFRFAHINREGGIKKNKTWKKELWLLATGHIIWFLQPLISSANISLLSGESRFGYQQVSLSPSPQHTFDIRFSGASLSWNNGSEKQLLTQMPLTTNNAYDLIDCK